MSDFEYEFEKPNRKTQRKAKTKQPKEDLDEWPSHPRGQQSNRYTDDSDSTGNDMITGRVLKVLDGSTLELEVTRQEYDNIYIYQDIEKVKIRGLKCPPMDTPEGQEMQQELEEELLEQYIACEIHGRDRMNTLLVTYELD